MTTKNRHATAPARPLQPPARERHDARDRPARPLTAAQLAAPSTRRWRRAGRFATSAG